VKVSVIIPCYNSANFIEETIQSVVKQNIDELEIICVDNGSEDNTIEVLKKLQDSESRIKIEVEPQSGASYARTKGLSISEGDFIQFLDSDDIIRPGKITTQMNAIVAQGVDWIVSDRSILNHDLSSVLESHSYNHLLDNKLEVGIAEVITSGNPLYKRQALEQVGGYTPKLKVGQDWDLHLKLILSDLKVGYVKGDFFHSRRLSESLSSNWVNVSDTLCELIIKFKNEFISKDVAASSNAMKKIHQTYLQSLIHSDNTAKKNLWLEELGFWNQLAPISKSNFGKLKFIYSLFGLRTYIKIKRLFT